MAGAHVSDGEDSVPMSLSFRDIATTGRDHSALHRALSSPPDSFQFFCAASEMCSAGDVTPTAPMLARRTRGQAREAEKGCVGPAYGGCEAAAQVVSVRARADEGPVRNADGGHQDPAEAAENAVARGYRRAPEQREKRPVEASPIAEL
ncbi:hypothetical protein GW17_00051238 [Ensete ventricosum]|nr:hypothetical protein GW17_00051238 [Ensete ventricosum]